MAAAKKKIGEILKGLQFITEENIQMALSVQASSPDKRLGEILVEYSVITEHQLTIGLGHQYMLPVISVADYIDNVEVQNEVPRDMMKRLNVFPLEFQDNNTVILIAISDPTNTETRKELRASLKYKLRFALAPASEIATALAAEHAVPQEHVLPVYVSVSQQPQTRTLKQIQPQMQQFSQHESVVLPSFNSMMNIYPRLGDILVQAGVLTEEQLLNALQLERTSGKKLIDIFVSEGILDEIKLANVLSTQLKLPMLNLLDYRPNPEVIRLVPRNMAERLDLIPLKIENNDTVFVAMSNPLDLLAQDEVRMFTSHNIRIGVTTKSDIDNHIDRLYNLQNKLSDTVLESYEAAAKKPIENIGPSSSAAQIHGDSRSSETATSAVSASIEIKNTKKIPWIAAAVALLALSILSLSAVMFFNGGDKKNADEINLNIEQILAERDMELAELRKEQAAEINAIKEQQAKQIQQIKQNLGVIDFSVLTEKILPKMLKIETERGTGSGFFISDEGDILTNYHVIEEADNIRVRTNDGRVIEALVKGINEENDIALLQLEGKWETPYLILASSLPKQGEQVMAVGSPKGLEKTVSNGIVSAVRWESVIQFTAPISPGSSGGALINSNGNVVGMTTAYKEGGQNLNFAIASPVLRDFAERTIDNEPMPPSRRVQKRAESRTSQQASGSRNPPKLDGKGIPLPDENGFLVHKWGCTVDSIRKYVASDLRPVGANGEFFSTFKPFKAFSIKADAFVIYSFNANKLCEITFMIPDSSYEQNSGVESIKRELSLAYNSTARRRGRGVDTIYSWETRRLFVELSAYDGEGGGCIFVRFIYKPLAE